MYTTRILTLLFLLTLGASANAKMGLSLGSGLPYTQEIAINYLSDSKSVSVDLGYNIISASSGSTTVSLSKPELNLKWHMFSGSFFLGVGLGQMSLSAKATDSSTGQSASITTSAMTLTPNLGWMWGAADGGVWAGFDIGYQMPSGASTTIDSTLPTTSSQYISAQDQANQYGSIAYPVISLRVGYLF